MTSDAPAPDWAVRWRGRDRFTVLATGDITRYLTAWRAWRDDAQRCAHLDVIVVADHRAEVDATSPRELAAELRAAWPPMTAGLHRLSFDDGRVNLLLAPGDLQAWLPELVARIDAFDLDDFPQAERTAKALARLAAPDADLSVQSIRPALQDALTTAGFVLCRNERDLQRTRARYAPHFTPKRSSGRVSPAARRPGRSPSMDGTAH